MNGDSTSEGSGMNTKPKPEEICKPEPPGRTVFPPPNSWYRSHVASARHDMWGYIALNMVVVVKPNKDNSVSEEVHVTPPTGDAVANGVENGGVAHTEEKTEIVTPAEALSNDDKDNDDGLLKKPTPQGRLWPQFFMVGIQRDKYSCLSFCQADADELPLGGATVVTGCEGGMVRIWDVSRNATVAFHDNHKGSVVTGVEWSPRNHFIIYSVDEQGIMTLWNLKKNSLQKMSFGKVTPNCLSVSPYEDNIVAMGSKGGNVFIIETTGIGKILHKMRHDEEVVSVRWIPEGEWDTSKSFHNQKGSSTNKCFLVSSIFSAKVPTVRVWDRQGKDIAVLTSFQKESRDSRKVFKYYGAADWARDPNSGKLILVTGGRNGEVVGWTNSTTPDEIHRLHSNQYIFSTIQCGDVLWSFSFEPVIIGWNLRTNHTECIIPTFKGVSSIMLSPVENTRVVIGGVDACIRILSMTQGYPDLGSVKPPAITHRLKGKITAVAWHPTRENKIGFGTDEGVLGIYEWKEDNKYALMFDRRVNGTVYTVDWGPQIQTASSNQSSELNGGNEKTDKNHETFMLYACGGQSVFMIHPSRHSNTLINVSRIIEKSNSDIEGMNGRAVSDKATEIRWAPDHSYLAVGFNDGRVELYTPPNLQMRCWIKCHGRAVQYMCWRSFDFLGDERKLNDRWFATASNDGTTRLFNLEGLFEKSFKSDLTCEPIQMISSVATLQGHAGVRIISLAFSPHNENLLVTVSYDRTAIVWNIKDGSQIARYMEHQHRLVACSFHPADPYKLITCSDELTLDFTIHIWDYRDHPFRAYAPKVVAPKTVKEDPIQAITEDFESTEQEEALVSVGKVGTPQILQLPDNKCIMLHPKAEEKMKLKLKQKARTLMPTTCNALINSKFSLNHEIRYIVDKIPIPMKMDDSTTSQVSAEHSFIKNPAELEDSISSLVLSMSEEKDSDVSDSTVHLAPVGDAADCRRLIELERKSHSEKGNWTAGLQLSNWIGDEVTWIRGAVAAGQVTDYMVVIAAGSSKKLYLEVVEAYAIQLADKEDYYKAVSYYLLAGMITEAVNLLVSKKMFRDALVLAKCRLPPEHSIHQQINDKWIHQLLSDGNFELAAKLYCSMGRHKEALTTIERRNFPYAWNAGVFVAVKSGDIKKAEMLGIKYILDSMTKNFHEDCFELVKEFSFLQWILPLVVVNQCLTDTATDVAVTSDVDGFLMWPDVLDTFKEDIKESWSSETYSLTLDTDDILKKIKSVLQLALPQNKDEAQQIIIKNITLLVIDEEERFSRALESYKLSKFWFEKNKPMLFYSFISVLNSLMPEWNLPAKKESTPLEVSACQLVSKLRLACHIWGAGVGVKKNSHPPEQLSSSTKQVLTALMEEVNNYLSSPSVMSSSDVTVASCVASLKQGLKELSDVVTKHDCDLDPKA